MSSLLYDNSSSTLLLNNNRDKINQDIATINYYVFYVQVCICLLGIFGNLLALIVINRKALRNTSSAVYVTFLAIFDSAVLLLHASQLLKFGRIRFFHCSLMYLLDLSTFCANWILVLITLERCVAVHSPFHAKRFCTVHSARRTMYIFLAASVIFFSILFPSTYAINEPSKTQKCRARESAKVFLRIYQPVLFYFIPDILLLSNLFTVYSLCRRQQRLTLTSNNERSSEVRVTDIHSNRKQRQLTIMLVTVNLSFYLFTTPTTIMYIDELTPRSVERVNTIKHILVGQISVIISQLNNATNFIFYCFAGERFRRATRETFYDYSAQLKTFYHRYILCNYQYISIPLYKQRLSYMKSTTLTNRSSLSPHIQRNLRKTSTI